jgi:Zn-dependent protease/predicted transcriptional regulator
MGRTFRIFTIGGIPVSIHASWLLIYALITWSLAQGYFRPALPELPAVAHWANGLLAALLLFVSVLLHELAHAVVARGHGLQVGGITLHIFGGVSQLEEEPESPRAEFWIAIVGPLTSFAIAALLWVVRMATIVQPAWGQAVVKYLLFVNVAVGIFNLLPGFPLDGGRVLRAALWKWRGSLARATYVAGRVGTLFAYLLIGLGVIQILGGALFAGLWSIMIGLFLRGSADASYQQVTVRSALEPIRVRDIMATHVVSTELDATIAELADSFWAHHFTSLPVVDGQRVIGVVSLHQVHEVPQDRWRTSLVRQVMRPLTDDLAIRPDATVFEALEKASRNGLGRLAVMEGARLVGYVSLKDITHVLVLRGVTGAASKDADATRPPRELRRIA